MMIPTDAAFLLSRLRDAGFAAYVVGGCVRDALLGVAPKDWDVCTAAKPEEMQRVFADQRVVETGLKHGTLTVVLHHEPYEVTTFRVDGAYTDHRHPDAVAFVDDVREDLARRDFTVNAMAWSPETGLVDAFGGQTDLAAGIIRCVGDARTRFGEDALRIMRALRFASVYGFAIDGDTADAIHEMKDTLEGVAAERLRVELGKLLCGKGCADILRAYHDVLSVILPEIAPMLGCEQHTPWHRYDVWEHTVRAVAAVPPEEALRLTMLLHDSGKPACFTMDAEGVGHAYGHQRRSTELAASALTRLKVDRATEETVLTLVERHDMPLSADERTLTRRLHQLGEVRLRQLIEVQRADAMGKGTTSDDEIEAWAEDLRKALDALMAKQPCFTLKQLAVNGGDLRSLGMKGGPDMGACLNALLEDVIEARCPNDKSALLHAAEAWMAARP